MTIFDPNQNVSSSLWLKKNYNAIINFEVEKNDLGIFAEVNEGHVGH